MTSSNILNKAISWAKSEELIRSLILVGSHAEKKPTDNLSDYDLSVFCHDTAPFLKEHRWMDSISPVWVSISEQFIFMGKPIPTRLTIFEGGHKIDFAFFPVEILEEMANDTLPDEFNMGYKVLVDKDQLTHKLPQPEYQGFIEKQPTEQEFHDLINEFWFEIYHVAKYLWRQDLWSVQFRMNSIHQKNLIKMICWNESAKYKWTYTTHQIGKQMRDWVGVETWNALYKVFPHFNVVDGWSSLRNTINLFKKLSHETADTLGYNRLIDTEKKINDFVEHLKKTPKSK